MNATNDPVPLSICVLTVSDSRTPDNDTSGDWLVEGLQAEGESVVLLIVDEDKGSEEIVPAVHEGEEGDY